MPPNFKRKILMLKLFLKPLMVIGLIFLAVIFMIKIYLPVKNYLDKEEITPAFINSLILNKPPQLKMYQGRTNILVLGIPGGDHDGAKLTDSMMTISLDWQKKDAVIVSIPRDVYLDSLKDKINSAYYYGEQKKTGGGLLMAKSSVEEVIGQPVHYSWVIDFSGFKKIIDLVGGIDVNVEKSFTDDFYPIAGRENDLCSGDPKFSCRYERLHFEKGLEHMGGDQVLKYVRSRQAEGEEGTDFARAKRQQQVILSLKNKVMNSSFILNNIKNVSLFKSAYDEATETDMKLVEQILFAKYFLQVPDDKIRRLVLDDGNGSEGRKGFLVNPPLEKYNGEWVLIPRPGSFSEIHQYIECNFRDISCNIKPD